MGTKTDTSMKKDVIITIASKQNFEGCEPDHINLITAVPPQRQVLYFV